MNAVNTIELKIDCSEEDDEVDDSRFNLEHRGNSNNVVLSPLSQSFRSKTDFVESTLSAKSQATTDADGNSILLQSFFQMNFVPSTSTDVTGGRTNVPQEGQRDVININNKTILSSTSLGEQNFGWEDVYKKGSRDSILGISKSESFGDNFYPENEDIVFDCAQHKGLFWDKQQALNWFIAQSKSVAAEDMLETVTESSEETDIKSDSNSNSTISNDEFHSYSFSGNAESPLASKQKLAVDRLSMAHIYNSKDMKSSPQLRNSPNAGCNPSKWSRDSISRSASKSVTFSVSSPANHVRLADDIVQSPSHRNHINFEAPISPSKVVNGAEVAVIENENDESCRLLAPDVNPSHEPIPGSRTALGKKPRYRVRDGEELIDNDDTYNPPLFCYFFCGLF